jgi:aminoglycoside phosphotransferase (APT) family kinase protein
VTSAAPRASPATDPGLPTLAAALDASVAERELAAAIPALQGLRVHEVRLLRHRPGRRAVLAYEGEAGRPPRPVALVAKMRSLRSGSSAYRLLMELRRAGLSPAGAGTVCVPEPLGVVRELRMWVQRRVPGTPAAALLGGPGGAALAARIAEAAHLLHRAGVPTTRAHLMADELRVLHQRLAGAAAAAPGLGRRIERLREACDRVGGAVPAPAPCGVHRDLHPDQILVDCDRLWLLDFDLYCLGDPALDAGNFAGHIAEQAVRERGDQAAFRDREAALEERFAALAGARTRPAARAYAFLTLARLTAIAAAAPDRGPLVVGLVEACEERLGLGVRR